MKKIEKLAIGDIQEVLQVFVSVMQGGGEGGTVICDVGGRGVKNI